jgi:hypothetical protein
MKTRIQHFSRPQQGSALIITMVMALAASLILMSFFGLLKSRSLVRARAMTWNSAMPLAEAGIEEALTHFTDDINSPAANGWTLIPMVSNGIPQQVVWRQRTFPDGSYYQVWLFNANLNIDSNNPNIYSTGYMPAPLGKGGYLTRSIRLTGTNPPLVSFAIAAVSTVQMNGNGWLTDSFNSSNPNLSNNGQYDPNRTSTNGNVGSVNGPVNFGNHSIKGSLYLGPGATNNSSVTSLQVSGGIYDDFNVYFPDVRLPITTWNSISTTTVQGKSVYDFTNSGDYYVSDSTPIIVEPGVQVRVRVDTTTFNPSGISILSSGGNSGTLQLYQVSGSADLSGGLSVNSGRARNFYYYGLPGVTSIKYGGNSAFIGVMYAPEADLTLTGGGNNNVDLIGASITKTVTMNGHFSFHFDEDLLTAGPGRGFVMTSWNEVGG